MQVNKPLKLVDGWSMYEQLISYDDANYYFANFIKNKYIIMNGYSCYLKYDFRNNTLSGKPVDRVELYKLANIFLCEKSLQNAKNLVEFLNRY